MGFLPRWAAIAAGLAAAAAATACSTQKYQTQIDAQKAEILALQQKNYQLELALSQRQAQVDELARRPAEAHPERGGEESASLDPNPARRRGSGGGPAAAPVDTARIRKAGFQVTEVDGLPAIVLPGEIFDLGKASLTAHGQATVKKLAAFLRTELSGHSFRVDGHTDNQPIKKHKDLYRSNLDLSSQRASAVAEVLIASGLDANRVSTASWADSRPRDTNATPAGRQKNRRAEVVVIE
jgi:chemotaxis protein MotB